MASSRESAQLRSWCERPTGHRPRWRRIGPGLCVLVGVTHTTMTPRPTKLAAKVWNLRIFADEDGAMNRSAAESGLEVLVVSQFTLYGDTRKGRRPSFVDAARPGATPSRSSTSWSRELRRLGATVATGRFRTDMACRLVNDGPVTVLIET